VNDRDFAAAVETCRLGRGEFRHADHVRLAWIYLRERPLVEAIDRFAATLRRLAAHHGVPGLYHETITWAYLLLIHERRERGPGADDWDAFRSANADLFAWRPSILERYYAPATLASELARRTFVLPDAGLREPR
jgi:hypothetical protein